MAEVWLGHDPASGQECALKRMRPEWLVDEESRERFQREARVLSGFRHPGLVGWLETGWDEQGAPWIAMELLPGGTLRARVEQRGPLPPREAAGLGRDLARTLADVHARGVLHRDLKPDNVLFDAQGRPRLSDFGLARPLFQGRSLTAEGAILGSPGYLAPEQILGEKAHLGPGTDVFGLGATLYFALTGAPPFDGPTPVARFQAALTEDPAPPSRLRPGVPAVLDAIVLRCLARAPQARFPSAFALAAALESCLAAERGPEPATERRPALPGVSPSPAAPAKAPPGRRALVLGAGGALLLAGAALLVAWWRAAPGDAPLHAAPPTAPEPSPSAPAAGASPPADPATRAAALRWVKQGEQLLRAGDLGGTAEAAERALALDAGLATAWALRADVRLNRSDDRGGLQDAERALELDPQLALGWALRAAARAELGQLGAAAQDAERALALDPALADAWVCRSLVRLRTRDLAGALQDATRGVELDPGQAAAWITRGAVRAAQGDLEGALADSTRGVELAPRLGLARINRAAALHQLGDLQSALADLERGLALDPGQASGWALLAECLLGSRTGAQQRAFEAASRATELDPELAQAWSTRAAALLDLGQPERAIEDAGRALRLDPGCAQALVVRGQALAFTGRREEGRADLQRALELPAVAGHPGMRRVVQALLDRLR